MNENNNINNKKSTTIDIRSDDDNDDDDEDVLINEIKELTTVSALNKLTSHQLMVLHKKLGTGFGKNGAKLKIVNLLKQSLIKSNYNFPEQRLVLKAIKTADKVNGAKCEAILCKINEDIKSNNYKPIINLRDILLANNPNAINEIKANVLSIIAAKDNNDNRYNDDNSSDDEPILPPRRRSADDWQITPKNYNETNNNKSVNKESTSKKGDNENENVQEQQIQIFNDRRFQNNKLTIRTKKTRSRINDYNRNFSRNRRNELLSESAKTTASFNNIKDIATKNYLRSQSKKMDQSTEKIDRLIGKFDDFKVNQVKEMKKINEKINELQSKPSLSRNAVPFVPTYYGPLQTSNNQKQISGIGQRYDNLSLSSTNKPTPTTTFSSTSIKTRNINNNYPQKPMEKQQFQENSVQNNQSQSTPTGQLNHNSSINTTNKPTSNEPLSFRSTSTITKTPSITPSNNNTNLQYDSNDDMKIFINTPIINNDNNNTPKTARDHRTGSNDEKSDHYDAKKDDLQQALYGHVIPDKVIAIKNYKKSHESEIINELAEYGQITETRVIDENLIISFEEIKDAKNAYDAFSKTQLQIQFVNRLNTDIIIDKNEYDELNEMLKNKEIQRKTLFISSDINKNINEAVKKMKALLYNELHVSLKDIHRLKIKKEGKPSLIIIFHEESKVIDVLKNAAFLQQHVFRSKLKYWRIQLIDMNKMKKFGTTKEDKLAASRRNKQIFGKHIKNRYNDKNDYYNDDKNYYNKFEEEDNHYHDENDYYYDKNRYRNDHFDGYYDDYKYKNNQRKPRGYYDDDRSRKMRGNTARRR